ncbi:MAG: oxygenase MpaB family protein, partial [Pacificimonas sp.]
MSPVKDRIASEIRALFAPDGTRDVPFEPGVGLFPADSISRQVHGNVVTMMIGGVSALFLQMLHPGALGGVWDHSDFRKDMLGRLRRTARFIGVTTFGQLDDAEAAIARVRQVHDYVKGTLPDGTPYSANDPELLRWVHVTELVSFLAAYRRYRDPAMGRREADRYFAENVIVAERLGATDVPASEAAANAYLKGIRHDLLVDARVREVAGILMAHRADNALAQPGVTLLMKAGIDLMPDWARRMHGFS